MYHSTTPLFPLTKYMPTHLNKKELNLKIYIITFKERVSTSSQLFFI